MIAVLPLAALLSPPALAAERIFIANADRDRVEVYDDLGASLGDVSGISGKIVEMERSAGGSYVYTQRSDGTLSLTSTRSLSAATSPGYSPWGTVDIAVSPTRGEVYASYGGDSLYIQSGSGAGVTGSLTLGGDLGETATTRAGDQIYAMDDWSGALQEWDLASGTLAVAAWLDFDVWELGVSRDDRYVVAAGPDTLRGADLGDPTDPVHVVVFDRALGTTYAIDIAYGGIPLGLEFSATSGMFWIATERDVQPLYYFSGSHITRSLTTLGGAGVADIASDTGQDLYVLYADRLDRYAGGWTKKLVKTFPASQLRTHLQVVRSVATTSYKMAPPSWWALNAMAVERKQSLPWTLRAEWLTCSGCSSSSMSAEKTRASAFLAEEKAPSVADVVSFLAGAKGMDAIAAEAYLDDLLIVPRK